MTVSSEVSKSGPYTGNGVTVAFSYEFRILDETHIQVIRTEAGVDTVLTTGFTVGGVGEAVGGAVTFAVAPTSAQQITFLRNVPNTQEIDLVNQGAFFAEVVEEGFDLASMRDQQLQEQLDRALKIPVGQDSGTLDGLIQDIIILADNVTDINAVAAIVADVTAVAGVAANVTIVAGISANVTTVAGIAAAVSTAAGIDAEIVIVAGIAASVVAVAGVDAEVVIVSGIAGDVTIVSSIAADVSAVSGIAADVTTVAANISAILAALTGAVQRTSSTGSAILPTGTTAQRDGSPLAGYVRFNSTTASFEGYNGTAWVPVGGGGQFKGNNGTIGVAPGDIFRVNSRTLTANTTIAATENAQAAGPLEIGTGVTLTIATGGNLVIV